MLQPVYVCRDSETMAYGLFSLLPVGPVVVVPANVGIMKLAGCVHFVSASKPGPSDSYNRFSLTNMESISLAECEERYSSVPKPGEAWLVTEGRKYINWERVDQNMFLLNDDGSYHRDD